MTEDPEHPEHPEHPEQADQPEQAEPAGQTDDVSAPRPRRRGRTTLLIAGAAVLGVVTGACAGFLVQADRAPDKLPSLAQSTLTQKKGPGPEPLSAAQDRKVRLDGDLRKLLLRKPSGARADDIVGADGWLDLADYSDMYTKPDVAYGDQVSDEFRRAAVTGWSQGTRDVNVVLVQYRQEDSLGASSVASDAYYWAGRQPYTDDWAIPGTTDGMAYVHSRPGYEYAAEAHAWRGDVAVEIYVHDTKPITKKTIMSLAEQQMERL